MIFRILTFAILMLGSGIAQGQSSQLDAFIRTALESNVALQRQELSLERSLAALKEAKARYFPVISLQARYSVARGGRAFEIPVGDLMNPVYQNLNLLNGLAQESIPDHPAIPTYPSIENTQVNFLRETEQETFLRMAMPVYNNAILNSHRIQESLSQADRISVGIYKRELVKEVKTAYFEYLKALQGVRLYENTLGLVEENLRTTESLYRNHQVTVDEVYSARAQVQEVEGELAAVRKLEKTAQAYFNFLLNRDYDLEITIEEPQPSELSVMTIDEARAAAFRQREEFQQLSYYLAANDSKINLQRGERLPSVNLVADYGIQGTGYQLDQDADFIMGSLVLSWRLFDRSTGARVQQARIERAETEKKKDETFQQIGLQVVDAYYELEKNLATIAAAEAGVEAAERAFQLIEKKYKQGQANQVAFIQARTQLTSAERSLIITRYDYQISLAAFERVVAGYGL